MHFRYEQNCQKKSFKNLLQKNTVNIVINVANTAAAMIHLPATSANALVTVTSNVV